MLKKGIIQSIVIALIMIISGNAIPLHTLVHHHEEQKKHHELSFSDFEKPCCKKTDFHQQDNALIAAPTVKSVSLSYKVIQTAVYKITSLPLILAANKAPPLVA